MVKGSHFTDEQIENVRSARNNPEYIEKMKSSEYQNKRREATKQKIEEYYKNPKLCKCGCGNIVPPCTKYNGFRVHDFIEGHRTSNMKGKKHTDEAKAKVSAANKGKTSWCKGLTKETNKSLAKISENMKINNPMQNEDSWKKIVETRKQNGTGVAGAYKAAETRRQKGTQSGGKCKWYSYSGQKIQGLFELRFVKFLDSMDIKWTAHKGIEAFEYIGLDGRPRKYQPDIKDENGVYYDPHAKYFWDDEFEHKINEVRKNYPEKTFIAFHEDNYVETCRSIMESKMS